MVRKKKLVFHSDFALSKTGFGRNTKAILSYLFNTGKYEIISIAGGISKAHPELERTPWKSLGVVPVSGQEQVDYNSSPDKARLYAYGAYEVDKVISEEKPDVYITAQDFWGVDFVISKPWFNNITSAIWTTLDSLPLLPSAVKEAPNVKNYWVWSNFAEKEMHKLGHTHVKTTHGCIDVADFKPLPPEEKTSLREKNNISNDEFIIGFVFRNQLRKLINTQIEAYALFKKHNPEVKNTFLYTHTHYGEGWDIHRLCQQYGVDPKEVLCTYVCKETRQYFIAPFHGQDIENPVIKRKTLVTANVGLGVSDEQLNEIYNIFSLYSHPATSGACELPCVEAALTEKIITTAPYSFGEDIIENNKGSISMKFTFYTEHGTQFLKSQPSVYELSKIFKKVYEMKPSTRHQMEQDSRKWALENYGIEVNGKKIEEFIDTFSILEDSVFEFKTQDAKKQNPSAIVEDNPDNRIWVKSLYKLILDMEVTDQDEGLAHWLQKLEQNTPKAQIENYFRQVAQQELEKQDNKTIEIKDLFNNHPDHKKVLIVQPESIGDIFLVTSLLESVRDRYPSNKYKIYFATKEIKYIHTNHK